MEKEKIKLDISKVIRSLINGGLIILRIDEHDNPKYQVNAMIKEEDLLLGIEYEICQLKSESKAEWELTDESAEKFLHEMIQEHVYDIVHKVPGYDGIEEFEIVKCEIVDKMSHEDAAQKLFAKNWGKLDGAEARAVRAYLEARQ